MLLVISYVVLSAALAWTDYWYTFIRTPANYPPGLFCGWRYVNTFHSSLCVLFCKRLGPPGLLSFFALRKGKHPSLANAIVKMAGEYGPVIGLTLWHRKFVCISGHQAVVDALSNPALSGRPNSFDFSLRTKGLSRGNFKFNGTFSFIVFNWYDV